MVSTSQGRVLQGIFRNLLRSDTKARATGSWTGPSARAEWEGARLTGGMAKPTNAGTVEASSEGAGREDGARNGRFEESPAATPFASDAPLRGDATRSTRKQH